MNLNLALPKVTMRATAVVTHDMQRVSNRIRDLLDNAITPDSLDELKLLAGVLEMRDLYDATQDDIDILKMCHEVIGHNGSAKE